MKAPPLRILVTGFGSFPGVHDNPTALLLPALSKHRARLARLGIALERAVLPVDYAEVVRSLVELNETLKPDAILHFGLAARRKAFSVETRALNRLSLLRCDASGAHAAHHAILPAAPQAARSTFPARQIEAELRRAGLCARLSVNAGSYICNETLYLSLAGSHARSVGFIHVPRLARADRPTGAGRTRRPDRADLTRAVLIAIFITARKLRQDLAKEGVQPPARHDFVKMPGKRPAIDRARTVA